MSLELFASIKKATAETSAHIQLYSGQTLIFTEKFIDIRIANSLNVYMYHTFKLQCMYHTFIEYKLQCMYHTFIEYKLQYNCNNYQQQKL